MTTHRHHIHEQHATPQGEVELHIYPEFKGEADAIAAVEFERIKQLTEGQFKYPMRRESQSDTEDSRKIEVA